MISRTLGLIGLTLICGLTIFDVLKVLTPLGFMGELTEFSHLMVSSNVLTT